ncbi:MAG: dimethylamine/trimethylamine dehydrogenase [Solirubrobacteraceae bacterium]|jgi:dimethylamine/trimethylamine dehydrogenase|nr:dimethylamine/trimethylamine dehydrogenase [Solirubrobacteraceae bacterium]
MARDPRHDILFEPVPIGCKTLRNRFYQSPHCTSFGAELPGPQAHIRAVKAEGGWAAVNTEFCSIHPSSDSRPLVSARLWDDEDARNLGRMAELAHEHGALAGVELWHGGCVAGNLESRLPARSVSQMTDESLYSTSCYELDRDGIREIQGWYVAAARRARDVGFDLINIEGAECGALTQHFFMSKFNRRTDEYGGSVANRARFWLEVTEQVREAVGDDCAVTMRVCVDTLNDNPLGIRAAEEAYELIELGDHLVDFWDLQAGGYVAAEWAGDDAVASRFAGEFSHRRYIEAVRPATRKPIAAVGRFTNPDTMAEAIRSGVIDIVAAARPSIADPFLPQKIEQGRYDEIRECIGCNICASRFGQGAPIVCTQNATLGEEFRRGWHPERFSRAANAEKTVLVVGAGPAGMECAMVLGKRGLSAVHLVDEQDGLGGSLRAISAYPHLGEWGRVTTYRQIQLAKLANVEVVADTRLDAAGVLDYGADIVVVATGARWRADGMNGPTQAPIPGAELDFVHTPEQVSARNGAIDGEHVLVYDTDGYFTAVAMAEMLLAAGKRVTVLTPFANFASFMFFTGEAFRVNRELRAQGVTVITSHVLSQIGPDTLAGQNVWSPEPVQWQADAVVLVTQRQPQDALYHALKSDPERLEREGIESLHRIGDCLAPRTIAENVFDGHRLAREIDSLDPSTPLPYLRELPDAYRERALASAGGG